MLLENLSRDYEPQTLEKTGHYKKPRHRLKPVVLNASADGLGRPSLQKLAQEPGTNVVPGTPAARLQNPENTG
jgi:hypothetical protein